MLDLEKIQKDFCQLSSPFQGKIITYLDSAATTLKPKQVVESICRYYQSECANVHRGIHTLSEAATLEFEGARDKVKNFINAQKREEIIFTKGTTESLNLIAYCYAQTFLREGDEILISALEHHSNIVPWQIACEKTGAKLKVIPINDRGELLMDEYAKLLNPKVKILSVGYVSNALGTVNPVQEMIDMAKRYDVVTVIDAAQASAHEIINVQKLDCDFLAFSGHKSFGPTGVGILYGKEALLNQMPPFLAGGDMIDQVSFERTTYNTLPHKFEAGTPHIAGVIGLGRAIEYIEELGLENIKEYETMLLEYATNSLNQVKGLKLIGTARNKASVLSFVMQDIHPNDIATLANNYGIALRTGHHCAQPLMRILQVPATARASLSIYNTKEDIDKLQEALIGIQKLFA